MTTIFLVLGVIITGFSLVGGWLWLCIRRPDLGLVVVVGLACFSAHVLSLLFQAGLPAGVVRQLIPLKDVAAVTLAGVLVLRAVRMRRFPVPLLTACGIFALLAVWGLFVGHHAPSDVALSLRNAAVPFVATVLGLLLDDNERRRAVRGLIAVVTVGALYALVELLFPVAYLRYGVGVGDYWLFVKEQAYHLAPNSQGLPGNFFTASGERRLTGAFGDPLAAGYALAAGVIAAFFASGSWIRKAALPVMALALLLTFTRAGWIIALSALVPAVLTALLRLTWRVRLLVTGISVMLGGTLVAVTPHLRTYLEGIVSGRDDSTRGHLRALADTGQYDYSTLGDGWGAAGGAVGRGTESVFVTVALQVGLVGMVLYVASLALLAWGVRRRWQPAPLSLSYFGMLAGLLVSMAVSEQVLTFNAGLMVVLPLALGATGPLHTGLARGSGPTALTRLRRSEPAPDVPLYPPPHKVSERRRGPTGR